MKKKGCMIGAIILFVLMLIGGGYIFFKYYYVIAEGVKEGQLNNVTYKGYIFKTYEGKAIMTGFKQGTQSNEFVFSIEDKDLAEKMMKLSGRGMQLHYKEYGNALPWRGYTKYIVDSICSVEGGGVLNHSVLKDDVIDKIVLEYEQMNEQKEESEAPIELEEN